MPDYRVGRREGFVLFGDMDMWDLASGPARLRAYSYSQRNYSKRPSSRGMLKSASIADGLERPISMFAIRTCI